MSIGKLMDHRQNIINRNRQHSILLNIISICLLSIGIPYIITMLVSGNAYKTSKKMNNVNSGKEIIVKIDNKNQIIDVEQYIAGIIAAKIIDDKTDTNANHKTNNSFSDEVLRAEAVMLRTEIYYVMGDNDIISETEFTHTYYDEKKLKEKWGRIDYEANIIKIENAVLATMGDTE